VRPRFEYGEGVRVLRNIRNDGTFPGHATGTLLVPRGSVGFVRDVGTFLQDQLIYSVHFLDAERVVGCREEELQPADDLWLPSRFEFREQVAARVRLGTQGRVLVEQGEIGEVVQVIPGGDGSFAYHVYFAGRNTLQVPEGALEPAPTPAPTVEQPTAPIPTGTEP
jgi:nitrogen fixation protein NifZ